MNGLLAALAALGFGIASAVIPVLNTEVYIATAARISPTWLWLIVIAMSIGQTAGKLLLLEGSRRGGSWMTKRHQRQASRWKRWRQPRANANVAPINPSTTRAASPPRWCKPNAEQINRLLTGRRTAGPLVFLAASLGLPPLAVVTIAAGIAGQSRWLFLPCCLIGRLLRFALIALAADQVMHWLF